MTLASKTKKHVVVPAAKKSHGKKIIADKAIPSKAMPGKLRANDAARDPALSREIRKMLASHIASEDGATFHEQDLAAIGDVFLDFAANYQPGQSKITVFNPDARQHGYTSRHSVVMILNDDMPFLVDSTTAGLMQLGLGVHVVIHPVCYTSRDAAGNLLGFVGAQACAEQDKSKDKTRHAAESWMYIEIDETPDAAQLAAIHQTLEGIFRQVRLAVQDWQPMLGQLHATIEALPADKTARLGEGESAEVAAFLAWLAADHFTFLGMRDYHILPAGGGNASKGVGLTVDKSSGLGILRDPISVMFFNGDVEAVQQDAMQVFLQRKPLVLITKTHCRARVHRTTPMDAILIKRYDAKGNFIGERLFVGLFTSSAYTAWPKDVPLLRQKIATVLQQAGFDRRSHNGKAMEHILNTYPRDELFQMDAPALLEASRGVLHLQERRNLALFIRHDTFNRFVHCLIYVARDDYNTRLRKQFQAILSKTFQGTVAEYSVKITDDNLSQIAIIIRTDQGRIPAYDKAALEKAMQNAARGWDGRLKEHLVTAFGENKGLELARLYADAFPDAYCDSIAAGDALQDIAFIEQVRQHGTLALNLYQAAGEKTDAGKPAAIHLKWFNPGAPLSLSRILPLMHAMGLESDAMQGPYEITPKGAETAIWVHDCQARLRSPAALPAAAHLVLPATPVAVAKIKEKFEACLMQMWHGTVEADGFNQLVLLADLTWRETVVLRAVGKYLRQARLAYSEAAMMEALATYPKIARLLVQLFVARHDPAASQPDQKNPGKAGSKDAGKTTARLEQQVVQELRDVQRLEHDRILRRYFNVVQNILRTNYFQPDAKGAPKDYVAFKLNSQNLDDLPLPRPMVEVFVYSPRTEAIHLRAGKVARGGIRWSDRREDFRTEILGLMKAQHTKNTVIVPVGSKGGFVVKNPAPANMAEEGIACYKIMMRGLLDITDNRVGNKIVPPKQVVRLDGDDPYLVVAADKGTAKFSDIANAVSLEYGFWLGDAFASGGSAGYDHKGMGITARGAWEAVKRHFREMGKDIQKQPFTVVGVGDMSGDVFGNGMLLSPHIKLVGAFNHKHIFIDPTPDTAVSFAERQRLFTLPSSQWSDYNPSLLSKGGGVYLRDAKVLSLSKEARALFGFGEEEVTPDALLRVMLGAAVELLWFGGIGTYVKAFDESHADVGDRVNDTVRINAETLRAQVVGEGANLGMTQKARIAFALRAGRLNTDSIDNSAGVDTSDHEVNIKILLDPLVHAGKLDLKARNTLLAKMTDDVAKLVLRDNYMQTQTISVTQARGQELTPLHARMMHQLERSKLLNRKIEFLPDEEVLEERGQRSNKGLTRPELAVLMAYAKIALYDELLASSLPDNPGLEGELFLYFPPALRDRYAESIRGHRIRREIIATATTNSVVNHAGSHFVPMLREKTGKSVADIVTAYAVVRDVYQLRALWADLEKLDGTIHAAVQTELMIRINKMIERTALWYLQYADLRNTAGLVSKHQKAMVDLRACMEEQSKVLARDENNTKLETYTQHGVPDKIARSLLILPLLGHVPQIVVIADQTGESVARVAEVYFAVESRLQFYWLRTHARQMDGHSQWQHEATGYIVDDIYRIQANITRAVLSGRKTGKKAAPSLPTEALIEQWAEQNGVVLADYDQLFQAIRRAKQLELAMLNLVLRQWQQWLRG